MKKSHFYLIAITLLSSINISSLYALQITNYYGRTMRIEAEDCITYENYKVFPSTQTWISGNVVNKAKYLFTQDLENGLYSTISGPSVPQKLCFRIAERKFSSNFVMIKISTYDTCKLDITYNDANTNFIVYPNYECFAQELK